MKRTTSGSIEYTFQLNERATNGFMIEKFLSVITENEKRDLFKSDQYLKIAVSDHSFTASINRIADQINPLYLRILEQIAKEDTFPCEVTAGLRWSLYEVTPQKITLLVEDQNPQSLEKAAKQKLNNWMVQMYSTNRHLYNIPKQTQNAKYEEILNELQNEIYKRIGSKLREPPNRCSFQKYLMKLVNIFLYF